MPAFRAKDCDMTGNFTTSFMKSLKYITEFSFILNNEYNEFNQPSHFVQITKMIIIVIQTT